MTTNTAIPRPNREITLHIGCIECRRAIPMTLPMKGYAAFIMGTHIDTALPDTDKDTQHLLVNHICGDCHTSK